MDPRDLKKLLDDLHQQKLTPQQAIKKLKTLPYENLGFARVDHHRGLRSGMPEVIYCQGKTVAQIKKIILQHQECHLLAELNSLDHQV